MTQPESPTPPSNASTEPPIPVILSRPAATIEALLRERSQLDALLHQHFRREVTVLFSDLQGSTAYFERRGDLSGRQMVQRHNDLLFPLIAHHQGTVLKTIGDAIMASFADPAQAVRAAIAMQRALRDYNRMQEAAEQIHIRIGLNSGPALVEPRDVFGDVVNAAARVQACALPDQILISEATYRQLPSTISCRPVGAREVKGKSAPLGLFKVCWDDGSRELAPVPNLIPDVSRAGDRRHPPVVPAAPPAVPPLRSLDARQHTLPHQLTRFVGRVLELHEVQSSLRSARLVTLTGTGGAGKTRLALQVAADLLAENPDGTWFVELAGTAEPALVPRVVSSTIGLREQQGRLLLDTLVDHLGTKGTLLVLDNCEYLLDACAELADRLLRACAGLTVLATSREPLGITGEEGLSIGRDLGYKRMVARSLTQLATVALLEGRAAEARGLFEESLPLWEEIGHKSGLLDSLRGLGDVARRAGDLREAEACLRQSLEVSRATRNLLGEAQALQSLGVLAMSQGERDKAESWHRQALALWSRMEHLDGIAASLRALGEVAAAAARLLGAAEALREQVGGTVHPCDRGGCDRAVEQVRSGLDTEAFRRAWEAGRQYTVAQAVGLVFEATAASADDRGAQEEAPGSPLGL